MACHHVIGAQLRVAKLNDEEDEIMTTNKALLALAMGLALAACTNKQQAADSAADAADAATEAQQAADNTAATGDTAAADAAQASADAAAAAANAASTSADAADPAGTMAKADDAADAAERRRRRRRAGARTLPSRLLLRLTPRPTTTPLLQEVIGAVHGVTLEEAVGVAGGFFF